MFNNLTEFILIFLLRRVNNKKPLGNKLFEALARVSWSLAFEAVALRIQKDGTVQVYLTKRAHDESAYHDLWHVPGSIFRPGESLWDVVGRLRKKEFRIAEHGVRFVEPLFNESDELRGSMLSLVYLVELEGDDGRGEWFDVEMLPADIVQGHRERIIPVAVRFFKMSCDL